jgi:hypothetical protein
MPKQTVRLSYKVTEYVEVEAPTHIDGIVKAGQMLMQGELRPTGKGEIQQESAYIEMDHSLPPNCT